MWPHCKKTNCQVWYLAQKKDKMNKKISTQKNTKVIDGVRFPSPLFDLPKNVHLQFMFENDRKKNTRIWQHIVKKWVCFPLQKRERPCVGEVLKKNVNKCGLENKNPDTCWLKETGKQKSSNTLDNGNENCNLLVCNVEKIMKLGFDSLKNYELVANFEELKQAKHEKKKCVKPTKKNNSRQDKKRTTTTLNVGISPPQIILLQSDLWVFCVFCVFE